MRWMRCLPRQSGGLESIIFVSIDMHTANVFALMPQAGRGGSKWEFIGAGWRRPPQFREAELPK